MRAGHVPGAHGAAAEAVAAPPSGLVAWRLVPGKGRGVVATRTIPAGTEVERAPVIPVPRAEVFRRPTSPTVLEQYLLAWEEDEPGRELAMGCGLLMVYNHSAEPNVELRDGPEPETMSVVTLRDVGAGEELVYDYGVELWFPERR
ncbi:MAG: SET domain-containing protein-lysine N-methyltransferase [Gemmatimonadaceae bacterium]